MDAELFEKAEKIAKRSGATTREVLERCIRLGLEQEAEFASTGALGLEILHLLTKPAFRVMVEGVLGEKVDAVQLRRVEHMRESRKGGRVVPG